MRKILLFIHGTGVRRQSYDTSFNLIKNKLKQYRCDVSLEACYWGDDIGVKLPEDCKSVPNYSKTRDIGETPEARVLEIWSQLSKDPAFELNLLAIRSGQGTPYPLNRPHPVTQLSMQFDALASNQDFINAISKLGLNETPQALLKVVSTSPAFEAAKKSASAGSPEHRSALARAAVAALQNQAIAVGGPVFDGAARNTLVDQLEKALGNDVRGPFGALLGWYGRTQRAKFTNQYHERIGDILRYQARGEEWRDFLSHRIAQFPQDKVIVLAHSLGGIAAFETIVERKPTNVAHLITFGSQAPFLLEIDALRCMDRGATLPENFPQWTNFYDLNDPLSYRARELFDGRVTDHELQSGQSPGAAHSAYLDSDVFWNLVSSKLSLV